MVRLPSLAIGVLALTFVLPAAAEDYVVDPGHSSVVFKIGHLGASDFYGRFNKVSGELSFDENDLSNARVKVTVPATSVDTNNSDRDKHVRSPELLGVEEHPQIVFEAKGFQKTDEKDTYAVKGQLTFHGVTKDITVTAKRIGKADHPRFGKRIGFTCQFKIQRTEFGIAFPTSVLSDEVELTVGIEAVIPQEKKEG